MQGTPEHPGALRTWAADPITSRELLHGVKRAVSNEWEQPTTLINFADGERFIELQSMFDRTKGKGGDPRSIALGLYLDGLKAYRRGG